MTDEKQIKFFCDDQLGKLARWLRIIGQDTLYARRIADADLLEQARAENRIVLTRHRKLAEKAEGATVVCLAENYPALQLREVVEKFHLRPRVFSRCVLCNAELAPVEKSEVVQHVPPFVAATQERFTRCPKCGRIFWKATHHERVRLALREILRSIYPAEDEEEKT